MGQKLYESGIYRIRNVINDKCYYGSSTNLNKRWKYEHLKALQQNKHYNKHLQNAWNKYHEANFVFEIVEIVLDKSKILEREQAYLDAKAGEYNISKSAKGGSGKKSIETKNKISKHKQEWWKENAGIMTGEKHPFYGKHHKLETRKEITANRKDKSLTNDQVLLIRQLYETTKTSHRKLAKQFSIDNHRTIGRMLKGQTYIYVQGGASSDKNCT